jgi:uncharacterized protein (DUF2147 family)
MKKLLCLTGVFVGLAGLAAGPSSAAPARDPSGTWVTEDGRARIRVEKCGPSMGNLCGYVVWMKVAEGDDPAAKRDVKNPDPRKRGRSVLGHQLIMGLNPNEEGRYVGKIYNNEDGKSYDVTVWSEQPGTLSVKGCLVAFLCSTQTWTRATTPAPGQLAAATGAPGGPQPDPEWAAKPGAIPASAQAPRREQQPRPRQ